MAIALDYDLWDTVVMGVAASTDHALFQVGEGADATHNPQFTNMRGSGALPTSEKFTLKKILWVLDDLPAEADLELMAKDNWLEFEINQRSMLRSPLRLFADSSDFGGHFAQAAAANRVLIGYTGVGRALDPVIVIPGGTQFRVTVHQTTALSAATSSRIVLRGLLEIPGTL